ncbi:MAG: hypothetical protein U1C33_07195, partial [Candidatus Cloacimonadaceae bacterium]|nr:hypothetical protein [Candidatus Cloacimonadaceae bacterium]
MENITPIDIPSFVSSGFSISPCGKYALYATIREDIWIRELYLYEFETKKHTKILNDDSGIGWIHWMPDYQSVLLSRGGSIYRLDLYSRDEFDLEQDHWQEIFKVKTEKSSQTTEIDTTDINDKDKDLDKEPAKDNKEDEPAVVEKKKTTPAEKYPELRITWEGIEKRYYPIITGAGYLYPLQAIDDSTFYYLQDNFFTGGTATIKKANIYGKNIKELFSLGKSVGEFRLVGNNFYYLEEGVIKSYNLSTKAKSETKISMDYTYDRAVLNRRVFEQVWGAFGLNFYDPKMHGLDWQEMYDLYYPYLDKVSSIKDLEQIVNEMIGDVNASHTGFYPREEKAYHTKNTASLGLELDYYRPLDEGIKIWRIYPRTRLYQLYGIRSGDIITHIDGVKITRHTPLDSLLADKVGKRIHLKLLCAGLNIDAQMDGLSRRAHSDLFY